MLGIDPGLSRCGYGVIERRGRRAVAIAAGVIVTDRTRPVAERLGHLQREVRSLIAEHQPAVVAIERVLFQTNVRTAMSVGQASGVVLAEAANAGCEVAEYSPNEVKETVTGWGAAPKDQVERMVRSLLGIDHPLKPVDAADALARAVPSGACARWRRVTHDARHGSKAMTSTGAKR